MIDTARLSSIPSLLLLLVIAACQAAIPPASRTPAPAPSSSPRPTVTIEPSSTTDPYPNPNLRTEGDEEVVFDWTQDRCEDLDIPDLPVRAFRDAQSNVQLIAAHHINRRFVGPDLNTIEHDCTPIMRSASDPDPSMYSYHQWLASTYTEDGTTIYALVHDEYYGTRSSGANGPCSEAEISCNLTSITEAVSTDGGASYHSLGEPPGHVVASAPYPYEPGAGPYGFFEPSNVIKGGDGYYYFYVREHFYRRGGNVAAVCVMRTMDLSDPSSWLAWDGKDFTVSFINPYLRPDEARAAPGCASIPPEPGLGGMQQSITFNTYLNRYVMVGYTLWTIDRRETSGIGYSFSDDLIHWQPRKLVFEAELPWTWQPGDADYYLYPSLLDPDSPSRNFETTGKTAYLYLTHFNRSSSSNPLDRDLVRIPVEFFPNEQVGPLEANGIAWEFDTEGDAEGWMAWNQLEPFQVTNGLLVTESSSSDPFVGSPRFAVDAAALPIIRIRMKVSSGEGAQVFFVTDTDDGYDEGKSLRFQIQADGEFHEYVLDMSNVPGWQGAITQLRVDPVETQATIEIDYIRLGPP